MYVVSACLNARKGNMATFRYTVEEVSRGGFIAWNAVEQGSGHVIELESPMVAGAFPEIEAHLIGAHGLKGKLVYAPTLGDTFDQASLTWTFRRGGNDIVVVDIPRTILRVMGPA